MNLKKRQNYSQSSIFKEKRIAVIKDMEQAVLVMIGQTRILSIAFL